MDNKKTFRKNIFWWILYLTAFLSSCFAVSYFLEKNLLSFLVVLSISMLIYTFLIIKDLKFISSGSFFTMIFMALLMFGSIVENEGNSDFSCAFDERAFMLALSLVLFFFLISSVFWAKTKQNLKKLISIIFIISSVLMLLIFGTSSPTYYQNFIYTRIFILIFFTFSIFLIIKGKVSLRILGICGIFLSISALLLGALLFAGQTYAIEGEERNEVIAFIDPKAKEMFGYYNQRDFASSSFCKYCGAELKSLIDANPVAGMREEFGPYMYFEESEITRKAGSYYIEYPVRFQNKENLLYLTFVLENISPDTNIFGFSIHDKQEQ